MSALAPLFTPKLLAAHGGCAKYAELTKQHNIAELCYDRSRAVDVRIRMRRHHADKHR